MSRIVVVGAGPAGLSAAWHAARAGARVTVLEAAPRVGGLCATVEQAGFRFDLGGHRVLTRDHGLARRMRELLGPDLLRRRRTSVILWEGRVVRYPLEAADLARTLPWQELARAMASFAAARVLPPPDDGTFESWVIRRFGRHLYDRFFGPYTERLWGVPPRELAADWAVERISLVDLWDAVLRGAGLRRREVPRTYAREYLYPRRGIGQLFDALARDVERLGVSVVVDAPVAALETRDGRVTCVVVRDGTRHDCDAVVSTMPLPDLVGLLDEDAGRAARARLRYRCMRFLNLALDQPDFSDATWSYVAAPDAVVTRVQEPRRRSPDMAPPGCTSLIFECPCFPNDAVWSASDEELLDRVLADLSRCGRRVERSRVRFAFSSRVANGYPIYRMGWRDHRDASLELVAQRAGNLRLAGRQGLFRYINMETAMLMGAEAARQALAGAFHLERVLDIHRDDRPSELAALTA